eukprot:SAG31_NODE_621_length_13502_cov_18.057002_3_plen_515_part_00
MNEMVVRADVMSHWPGQAPTSYKRLLYAAIGHGTKILDLYEMHSTFGTTENSVGEYPAAVGTYEVALATLWEYGQFDDIVQDSPSQAAPVGDVAMLFSTAADIWDKDDTVHKAAKRALYIAIRHTHKSVDVLNEEDMTSNGTLDQYKTLYVMDPHVSSNVTAHIARWVTAGGTVYACGQAGFLDEGNANNDAMLQLLGLVAWTGSSTLPARAIVSSKQHPIAMLKRDLPTAARLDTVFAAAGGAEASMGAYGLLVRLGNFTGPKADLANTTVLARFGSDQTAAATIRQVGKGRAVFHGFFPSIAYFAPALPNRPIDICPRDGDTGCFCHFVPSAFDKNAMALLDLPPIAGRSGGSAPSSSHNGAVEGLASSSDPLVEVLVIAGQTPGLGVAVLLINWQMAPVEANTLTVSISQNAFAARDGSLPSIDSWKARRCALNRMAAMSSSFPCHVRVVHVVWRRQCFDNDRYFADRASNGEAIMLTLDKQGSGQEPRWVFKIAAELVVADAVVLRPSFA